MAACITITTAHGEQRAIAVESILGFWPQPHDRERTVLVIGQDAQLVIDETYDSFMGRVAR